ncbi:hypothetical protein ABZZ80_47595, partial [Streptomyces sp. NPDC006356]
MTPDLHDGLDRDTTRDVLDVDAPGRAEPGDRRERAARDRQVDDVRRAGEQERVDARQIRGGPVGATAPVHPERPAGPHEVPP